MIKKGQDKVTNITKGLTSYYSKEKQRLALRPLETQFSECLNGYIKEGEKREQLIQSEGAKIAKTPNQAEKGAKPLAKERRVA